MELEQVWSLHRSEKPTNTVRSREVPPDNGQLIQWLECRSDKANVDGSIPSLPTMKQML
jgi:hypothetical protein